MKLAIILGTRPEIIKFSPIIEACEDKDIDFFILHTNQHQKAEMDRKMFEELQVPAPQINLNIGEDYSELVMNYENSNNTRYET